MCPPEHFAVEYAINPWMDTDHAGRRRAGGQAVGRAARARSSTSATPCTCSPPSRACRTWSTPPTARSRSTARSTAPGSGTRSGPPRPPRTGAFYAADRGWRFVAPSETNEGEGDFAYLPEAHGGLILAGLRLPHRAGRRTPRRRRCSAARWSRCAWSTRASTTWTWRWPRSTTHNIAYFPGAFSPAAQRVLRAALPGRGARRRGRRAGLRPEPGQRRPARGAQREATGLAGEAGRGRVPAGPGRAGRAEEGRRQRQVLRRRAAPGATAT